MDAIKMNTSVYSNLDSEMNANSLLELCRICLLGSNAMRNLFFNDQVTHLCQKIMNFANVKVIPGDGLPVQICHDCAQKIESTYEFKCQVEQADRVLKDRFNFLANNVVEEKLLENKNQDNSQKEKEELNRSVEETNQNFVAQKTEEEMHEFDHNASNSVHDTVLPYPHISTEKQFEALGLRGSEEVDYNVSNEKYEGVDLLDDMKLKNADEENYFENLNLSSRLKRKQAFEKGQEVHYMCHLCDKEFLIKEVLKEHIFRHEEIKKGEEVPNSLEKDSSNKDLSSKKKQSVCPHCGKEYLYAISFKKHLKQHEHEKREINEEEEIQEEEESTCYDNDNIRDDSYSENEDKEDDMLEKENGATNIKDFKNLRKDFTKANLINSLLICPVCEIEFDSIQSLEDHKITQHKKISNDKRSAMEFDNDSKIKIANTQKTKVSDTDYNPNKRVRRLAAKTAQKIINRIKTETDDEECDPNYEEFKEELEDDDADYNENPKSRPVKQPRLQVFYCASCNKKCLGKQTLIKHMSQHREINKSTQNSSKKTSKNVSISAIYFKQENEEDDDDFEGGIDWPADIHKCPTCNKRYSTKKSLLRHQLLHEEPNFECDICSVKFYRKDKLKAHYDKCSERYPDQVRKCNICNDTFENNEILREHRSKHVAEGILTEEDLKDLELKPEERKQHIPRKRRTDIVGLECPICNKRYTSRKGLLRHIQIHEGKKYLCDICPKKFSRREHLKIHVAKHNMIKPYKCPRCPKKFIKEEQLSYHLNKHDRIVKKPKETGGIKRYLCEICSKSFTQSTTLVAHLRAHSGIKPYICEVCQRPFTTNAYLKIHMRTHTQERPYVCKYCSRAFARADTLANHLTSHTGEAKYHCKHCPKNFRRLKSLKEHVFIHTGQRPYACPTCDRKFNNNGSRYAHSKRCKQNLIQSKQNHNKQPFKQQFQTNEHDKQVQQQYQHQQQHQQAHLTDDHTPQQHCNLQQQFPQQSHQLMQIQNRLQPSVTQVQVIKPQNVKTITLTRTVDSVSQSNVMGNQEILMPLILPLTVTLADVDEEMILPEGAKIFTT